MAKEGIYALSSATHGGADVAGVTHARIIPTTKAVRDKKAKESVMTDWDLTVELYGVGRSALEGLIADAAADLVLTVIGRAAAAETHTLVGVMFTEVIQGGEAAEVDAGGKIPPYGIRGMCENSSRAAFSALWT